MGYCIELKDVSLAEYEETLKNQNLLPGRRILQDNIEENLLRIHDCGIRNLEELLKAISSPKKLSTLSFKSGLSEEYLTILKREIGSFIQKPVTIADFPILLPDMAVKLAAIGITTSKNLYEATDGFRDMKDIFIKTGISEEEAKELACLCDLVRINGVGAVFARILYEAGYLSIDDVASADADEMLKKVSETNAEGQYTKAKLGRKDMQFCIDFARLILKV